MKIPELSCREAARLLFGAADAALSGADRAALEAHIAECKACERVRSQVERMQRASAAWRRYRQSEVEGSAAGEGEKPLP